MWLKDNNALYKDIVINFSLTNIWKRGFVFAKILNRVLQCDKNIYEREDYAANLKVENFKNNFYYNVNSAGIDDLGLLSSCLYTNMNNI